jgi:uncharacterized membrane protein
MMKREMALEVFSCNNFTYFPFLCKNIFVSYVPYIICHSHLFLSNNTLAIYERFSVWTALPWVFAAWIDRASYWVWTDRVSY